ncbi:MAG TPA: HEAT repeat domain-containing protein [Planctomycetota bacterium]
MTILTGLLLSAFAAAQDAKEEAKKKEDEAKAKIAEFKKELKTAKTDADRAKTLEMLGDVKHPKVLEELKGFLKGTTEVAIAAAEQIGKYSKDKDAAETLMATAAARRDKDAVVKCIRYAGDVGVRTIVPKLIGFFKHKENDVAREAVDSCAKLRAGSSIDPLLGLWRELDGIKDEKDQGGLNGGVGGLGGGITGTNPIEDGNKKRKSDLTPAVESALGKITGENFKTLKEANDWWRKFKGSWTEPPE